MASPLSSRLIQVSGGHVQLKIAKSNCCFFSLKLGLLVYWSFLFQLMAPPDAWFIAYA